MNLRTFIMLMRLACSSCLCLQRHLSLRGDPCYGRKDSKEKVTVPLICNACAPEALPPFIIGKSDCFKNVRRLPSAVLRMRLTGLAEREGATYFNL
jgi:hypothetical protein